MSFALAEGAEVFASIAADDIVWESSGRRPESHMVIFATPLARAIAVRYLRHVLGYRYFTEYRDVQGYGLSTCRFPGRVEADRWRRSYR